MDPINFSEVACSFNCSSNTVYHVIDYYLRHNDVNYTDTEINNKQKIIYPRKLHLAINSVLNGNKKCTINFVHRRYLNINSLRK